jgi:hypothetical protein
MINNNLPVSRLINVDVILSPLAAQAQDLSVALILGNSNVIDVVERIRDYDSLSAVAVDFGTSSPEYGAAVLWFGQSPQPDLLKIGRWADTDTAAILNGGSLNASQQLMSVFNAYTAPGFLIYMDGIPYAINPSSFALATNLNGIAQIIENALDNEVSGTTCIWNAVYDRFEITSGTTGDTSTISFLQAPHSVGNILFDALPANNSTITLNGTVITFVTGTATGNQVHIEATLEETLEGLLEFLTGSSDPEIDKFTYSITEDTLYLVAVVAGAAGDLLTLAASSSPNSHGTVSGATLDGGDTASIATVLGMTSGFSGAYIADGIEAQTALETVALFDELYGQTWYGLNIPAGADNEDHIQVAGYIEATDNKHLYAVSTQDAGCLSSVSTTDIMAMLSDLDYDKTFVQYSGNNAYSSVSLLGRALTVDYNGNSTVITLMYKQEPGIVPENLTSTQANALKAKNGNVFVEYNNNTAIIQYGNVCSGAFIDEITGTDWLAVTIMTALYNLLYTSKTKIPQTDAGNNLLVGTCESVLLQGVVNGLLAPGVWNSNGFGTLVQGDFLAKGFYVYAPPVATQSQADREARKSVPIQIAAKLAGAVHTVDVTVNVSR